MRQTVEFIPKSFYGEEAAARCRVSVLIPAYNEESAIGSVLDEVMAVTGKLQHPWEILVIDDGSTDATGRIAAERERVRLLRHKENRGYGAALKHGIRKAQGDIIVITDADASYPNGEIPRLVETLSDCDMVVGSREGRKVVLPLLRRFPKWVLGRLANYLSGRKIPDLNSGLRAFRREACLPFMGIISDGFSFTTTLTLAMLCNDYEVKFLPVDYYPRKGRSKIRPLQDTLHFFLLILRVCTYFRPLRVFMPPGALLLTTGILHGLFQLLASGFAGIGEVPVLLILGGIQLVFMGLLADLISKRPPG
ncbi:MAG: glycosyltransferase family 2 protein [Deltaproteobacteria bacterium]|nr:glycosyltransferase family 2 protein [Deltaproteobacteria bacterium]